VIEELQLEHDEEDEMISEDSGDGSSKIFISHSSQDRKYVGELIELLEAIGLTDDDIICTSFSGYGIDLGENFLDAIKGKLRDVPLVLFVLSENFYASEICLCEMGATWVLTKEHIPVLIPPFDFADMKGAIPPTTNGLKVNDASKLTELKEKIESVFSLENKRSQSVWQGKLEKIVARIDEAIENGQAEKKEGKDEISDDATVQTGKSKSAELSPKAKVLLREAAKNRGQIILLCPGRSKEIQINGTSMISDATPRSIAAWVEGFEELQRCEYIDGSERKGGIFNVTKKGYDAADELTEDNEFPRPQSGDSM
jgi:hypothetical protein